jgi:Icc protein
MVLSVRADPVRLVQITDTHLIETPGAEIYGVDSFATLESALERIKSDDWTPDLVVHSGDLSDDGTAASYRRLRSLLTPLALPVYCVPGNHDVHAEILASLCGGPIQNVRSAVVEPWQIVFLDSEVVGKVHGHLDPEELTGLEESLADAPHLHALIVLHHGPLAVCPMPVCQLDNAEELWAILGRHSNVRGVLSGHNHCAVDEIHRGIRVLVTPSTCVQFEHPTTPPPPGTGFWEAHLSDGSRQALRRLELYPDGEIRTEVVWVD